MNSKTKLGSALLIGAAGLAFAGSVSAYEAGDWVVRGGLAGVFPNDSSGDVQGFPGNGVDVDDSMGIVATVSYMVTPAIGVELVGALPFSHDISATGPDLSPLGKIGETRQLPPTLMLNYHFGGNADFQPYAGLGLNHTLFFDEDTSDSLEGALGKSKLNLDSSTGVAFQLGADWNVSPDFKFNIAMWWIDINTTGTIDFKADPNDPNDDGRTKVDVEVDPTVIAIGFTKTF